MKLKSKVMAFFVVLSIFSGALIIGLTWNAVGGVVIHNVSALGISKVMDMAMDNVDGFNQKSETLLLPALLQAQKASGALYAVALDPTGRVLAHTNVAEKGVLYEDPLTLAIVRDTKPGTQRRKEGPTNILEAWAPVWINENTEPNEQYLFDGERVASQTRRLGSIRLAIPLQEALRTQTLILEQMSLIVLLIGSIAFFATAGLMQRLLIPIRLLVKGTQRVTAGEYGNEVPVMSGDELGDLANSFNSMSRVLAETTVSKEFLGGILSHMIDPLIVLNSQGEIKMVNHATLQLLGYVREELEGKPVHMLFMSKDHLSKAIQDEKLFGKGEVRNLEVEFMTKTSVKIPVLFSSSVLKDGNDKSAGIVVVAKDMTERKKLENAVRQSEKLSAVGQLAAGVAHEINNPLGVILGFAQAVVRRLQPQDPLEFPLRSIEKEAIRCKDLVQDLLTFSRVSKIDREPLDINRAVDGAFSLVTAQARISNVQVKKELAPHLPHVLGNLNQVQQIIINLANNALDALGDNAGTLTVKTETFKEDYLSWVCLKIADTGSGIAPEVQSRIFDPFFTTKAVGKGTGLGLSLVHEIVKKHSGTITVESRPGFTEFCVKFPVHSIQRSALLDHVA